MWFSNNILFIFLRFFTRFITLFLLIDSWSWSLSFTAKICCTWSHRLFPFFKLLMFRDVILRFLLFYFSQSFKKLLLVEISWFIVYSRLKSAFLIKFYWFLLLFNFYSSFILLAFFKKFLDCFRRIIISCWVVNLRFEWILDLLLNFWLYKFFLIRTRRPLV